MGSLSESWGQIHHEIDGDTTDSVKQELTAAYSPYSKKSMVSVVHGAAQEEDITAVYLGSTRKDSVVQKPKSRFYLSADVTGGVTGFIFKNYNPDGTWLRGYIALMPLYRIGNIYVGLGGAMKYDHYRVVAFQRDSKQVTKSLGIALNYNFCTNRKVSYSIFSRYYFNYYKYRATFNGQFNAEDRTFNSTILGMGPNLHFKKIKISPAIGLTTIKSFYTTSNTQTINTELLLNITYPIK